MKIIAKIILLVLACCFATGCVSFRYPGYFPDRWHDAADIFTVGVGTGIGGKAKVGPVQSGILVDFPVIALRGGEIARNSFWFDTPYKHEELLGGLDLDVQTIFCGGEVFSSCSRSRGKRFIARVDPFGQTTVTELKTVVEAGASYSSIPFVAHVCPLSHPYNWEIEVVGGIGLSFRFGFNPGELLDFILGWGTIDIFNDDLKRKKWKLKGEATGAETD